ncbi:WD repeat-containing protein 63 [Thalassophryne amazonica]|uniref:WD repeat-containing protein 63 n=1 Tax=Thalassophryne amazonica TaxID=390379 RepID=UPI001471350A|nr:WD repeat-containing protein 63 [Thalassophryne amazonica]
MASKRPKSALSSADSTKKKKDHPADIFPIVLTSATQEHFGCRADEDVTGENPYKLLRKEDIMEDIKKKAALSDFSSVKQFVEDYPQDELLLVFDRDFTCGQSFYLVLTLDAKERILSAQKHKASETSSVTSEAPESKHWVSHGSDVEIEKESVKESREKVRFRFSRVRREFGRPVCFSDSNAADNKDRHINIPSYEDSRFNIKKMQRECSLQGVPNFQSSSTQTERKSYNNMCTQYEARELNDEEREKILQYDSLKNFCKSVTPRFLYHLQQNEIMDVFVDDWKALQPEDDADWSGKVSEGLKLYWTFTDPKYSKNKIISCINWHPTIYGVIAVALTDKSHVEDHLNESMSRDVAPFFIVFYSFLDPSNCQLLLKGPDDIFAFEFCPSDPNIIVGGCKNGQVVLWDISTHVTHLEGTQPKSQKTTSVNTDTVSLCDDREDQIPAVRYCAVSALASSHKAPITDVQWIPHTFEVTRMGVPVKNINDISIQFITCSSDCSFMFWDIRLPAGLATTTSINREQKPADSSFGEPDTFKHLSQTWKPLFRVSLRKIDTRGEYIPYKFSLDRDTGQDQLPSKGLEVTTAYKNLRLVSAKEQKMLQDVNTKLYIGTVNGEIIYTDWKLEKDDSGQLLSPKPLQCSPIHHWLVNSVQRSPFFKDIILTAGGWNFAIWKEGVMNGPIMQSMNSEQLSTVGCWSLSRPAVFFIGKKDGSIEMWNLLESMSDPSHIHPHVTNGTITSIKPWAVSVKQHLLAVTDDLGVVRILEIPRSLYRPFKKENVNMRKYFDLKVAKLMDFLKKRKEWGGQTTESKQHQKEMRENKQSSTRLSCDSENMLELEYQEYLKLEETILKNMGLLQINTDT